MVFIPKRSSNGEPRILSEPFIHRNNIDNPLECGFSNKLGDSLNG